MNPTHAVFVPIPFPKEFESWNKNWLEWIKSIDGIPVSIYRETTMFDKLTQELSGFVVISEIIPPTDLDSLAAMWLPKEWLIPLNGSSECSCDARDLFNFGCRGHQ